MKMGISLLGLKILGLQKKHKNNKCLKKHSLQLLFHMYCCEINIKILFSLKSVSSEVRDLRDIQYTSD